MIFKPGRAYLGQQHLENSVVLKSSITAGNRSSSGVKREMQLDFVLCRGASTKDKKGVINKRLK